MYCFIIKPTKAYSYGCAIVAAHNVEEAIKTYCTISSFNDYLYDELNCTCNIVNKLHYDTESSRLIYDCINEE